MNSEARRSCHGWIVDLSFRTSRPEGERQGSIHGARKSQNRMVSPPRMISPDGERIRYLPSPVGACACATDAPGMEHTAGDKSKRPKAKVRRSD